MLSARASAPSETRSRSSVAGSLSPIKWDPRIYAREAIDQYNRSNRNFARTAPVAVAVGIMTIIAIGLHWEIVALSILAVGSVVVLSMIAKASRERMAAAVRIRQEHRDCTAHHGDDGKQQ